MANPPQEWRYALALACDDLKAGRREDAFEVLRNMVDRADPALVAAIIAVIKERRYAEKEEE
jgi:hypothetical protein